MGVTLVLAAAIFCWKSCNPVVAKVGNYSLTKRDVDLRTKIIQLHNGKLTRQNALEQLVASYTRAQILENMGAPISSQTILDEEKRLDSQSVSSIRGLFGSDIESYRRLYVLPMLAERALYQGYFLKKSSIQLEARAKAEAFLQAFRKEPRQAKKLAEQHGLELSRLTVSRRSGLTWEQGRKLAGSAVPATATGGQGASPEGEFWVRRVVSGLKPGEVRNSLQEYGTYWLAVRLLGPAPDAKETYRLEVVRIPQADFSAWYREQAAHVKVQLSL
jgi:hypothetical protein